MSTGESENSKTPNPRFLTENKNRGKSVFLLRFLLSL